MNLFRKPPPLPSASPPITDTLLRAAIRQEKPAHPGGTQEPTKADEMVRLMAERHRPRRRS